MICERTGVFFGCAVGLALLLVVGLGREAQAYSVRLPNKKMLRINLSLSSVLEYHTRNKKRIAHSETYSFFQNKADFSLQYDEIIVGGRGDTYNFFADQQVCHAVLPACKAFYQMEKLYVKVRKGKLDFVGGDFYLTLGRGIALSIRKVSEFGIDNTLRGGRVSYNDETTQVTVGGGFVNSNNLDPVEQTLLKDTDDFIFGGRLDQTLTKGFGIAVQYAYYRLKQLPNDDITLSPDERIKETPHERSIIGGALKFDRIAKNVDIYFEGDALVGRNGTEDVLGYAFYASLNGYFFPVTLRIEAKWYRNFIVKPTYPSLYRNTNPNDPDTIDVPFQNYINPPSMEREDLDTFGLTENMRGIRLRIDYTFPSRDMVIFANIMFRAGEVFEDQNVFHIFTGLEYRKGRVNLKTSVGWREATEVNLWRILHADVDLSYRFLPRHSAELVLLYRGNVKFDKQFHIFDLQMAYAFSKVGSVALLFSYSDEFKGDNDVNTLFFAVEATAVLWGYGTFKFTAGATRGGQRCVSGVCRNFPYFEGVRGELMVRF